MNLQDIVNGSTVLIDTNVLLYAPQPAVAAVPPIASAVRTGCSQRGRHVGPLLPSSVHRCMVQEAQGNGLVGSNPARALSERP